MHGRLSILTFWGSRLSWKHSGIFLLAIAAYFWSLGGMRAQIISDYVPEHVIAELQYEHAGKTALRAIRLRCLDRSGASAPEVASCKFGPDHPTNPCDSHSFRMGKGNRPTLTDAHKAALAEGRARMRSLPAVLGSAITVLNADFPV
jgi:hypothetical protein